MERDKKDDNYNSISGQLGTLYTIAKLSIKYYILNSIISIPQFIVEDLQNKRDLFGTHKSE